MISCSKISFLWGVIVWLGVWINSDLNPVRITSRRGKVPIFLWENLIFQIIKEKVNSLFEKRYNIYFATSLDKSCKIRIFRMIIFIYVHMGMESQQRNPPLWWFSGHRWYCYRLQVLMEFHWYVSLILNEMQTAVIDILVGLVEGHWIW